VEDDALLDGGPLVLEEPALVDGRGPQPSRVEDLAWLFGQPCSGQGGDPVDQGLPLVVFVALDQPGGQQPVEGGVAVGPVEGQGADALDRPPACRRRAAGRAAPAPPASASLSRKAPSSSGSIIASAAAMTPSPRALPLRTR
jgi:hypothetical protein